MNIDSIIKENINKFLIKEYYSSPLYHFTDLYAALQILRCGYISKQRDPDGDNDSRMDGEFFVSLSRNKNFKEGYQANIVNAVRFEFDPETIMNNIRKSRILPHTTIPSYAIKTYSEYEERFYSNKNELILKNSLKSITLNIKDINFVDMRTVWIKYELTDEPWVENLTDVELNKALIERIVDLAKKNYGVDVIFE